MVRLLIVDDEAETAAHVEADLLSLDSGYRITRVESCGAALQIQENSFDIILLDIILPDAKGIDLCPLLRARHRCPILFISCLDDSDSIVQAFDQGGDDYVCKPFDSKVLHARIQANLRRVNAAREQPQPQAAGDYVLDGRNYTVLLHGEQIQLLPIEFHILAFLLGHPGQYFKSKELYQIIWGADSFGDTRTVHVHIHNLRRKLHDDMDNPRIIRNERGRGYTMSSSSSGSVTMNSAPSP